MARQPRPAGRFRTLCGALTALAIVLAPLTTPAETVPEAVEPLDAGVSTQPAFETATVHRDQQGAAQARRRALRAVIPVVLLLVVATSLLLVELRRRRREQRPRRTHLAHRAPMASARFSDDVDDALVASSTGHTGTAIGTAEVELAGSNHLAVLAGLVGELHDPDDGGAPTQRARRADDSLDLGSASMACPTCQRTFEMGTRFCPWHGELLHATEHDAAPELASDDHVMVCPECAAEYEPGAIYCADDHARLLVRSHSDDPAEVSPDDGAAATLGSAPMVVCTGCAREFRVGQSACPDCGDAGTLRLLHGRTTRGLWVDAPPYSRICPECGSRYSEELGFCTRDGQPLERLN